MVSCSRQLGYVKVLLVLAFFSCSRPQESSTRPVGDEEGNPTRIVSTMPSTTDMLYRFGAWSRVVGVSVFCDFPAEATDLPKIGSGMDPDVERILSLRPDLVVGSIIQEDFAFVRTLRQANIEVFLVRDQSLEDVLDDMPRLGRAVGQEAEATAVVEATRAALRDIADRTDGRDRPRTLLVFDHHPIYAAGPETFVHELLVAAGGENAVTAGGWVQLDREAVIRLAPEVIFEPTVRERSRLDVIWASWHTLPAVNDGRIHSLVSEGVSRPGPSMLEATLEMAQHLHPHIFADPQ